MTPTDAPAAPPVIAHSPGSGGRVVLTGATGTIGRAVLDALLARGHQVVCALRPGPVPVLPDGAIARPVDLTDPAQVRTLFGQGPVDAVLSCMASRSGAPRDAWAVDHDAQQALLTAAGEAGVRQFVLLSAICVQKPLLEFQRAKLAFEASLAGSGIGHSIVRPTAYFKSLSGQVDRIRQGRRFLLVGDGRLTACTPISDRDLAAYIADCLTHSDRLGRVLPIGGPGPAITPHDQAQELFRLTGRKPALRHVPVALFDAIVAGLSAGARIVPSWRDKAEFARTGRYYATESMLVLNPATGLYDREATPATGSDTLFDHYARLIRDGGSADLGAHAVFDRRRRAVPGRVNT